MEQYSTLEDLEDKIDGILKRHERRILLVAKQGGTIYSQTPHMGLDYLAMVAGTWEVLIAEQCEPYNFQVHLKKDGEFSSFGFSTLDELIDKYDPAVIGFSFTSTEAREVMETARMIMSRDDPPILIAGGPHPTVARNSILKKHGYFDLVVEGKGEQPLKQLLARIDERNGIETIEATGCDEAILTPKDIRDAIWEERRVLRIILNEGCLRRCEFCFQGAMEFRTGDVDRAIGFVREAKALGYEYLFFEDGEFSPRINTVRQLLERLAEDDSCGMDFGAQLRWDNFVKADNEIDRAHIDLFKKAGFKYLFLSIESVCSAALENMNKRQLADADREERIRVIKRVFTALSQAGIDYGISTIIGYEGDSIEEFERTIRLIADVEPKYVFIETAKVYPATPCAKRFVQQGVIEDVYTWGESQEGGLDGKLFLVAKGSISPEDDDSLVMIDPKEAKKWLELAGRILLERNYAYFGSKAAFVRFPF